MPDEPISSSPSTLPNDISEDGVQIPEFEFTNFPLRKLSPEVQQRIWKVCARIPQDIEVKFTMKGWESRRCRAEDKVPKFTSITPTPVVLRICHESRVQGLKLLKTCFRTNYRSIVKREGEADDEGEADWVPGHRSSRSYPSKKPKSHITRIEPGKGRIYINPDIDTLYVSFDAWCWPYVQAFHDWMYAPDDTTGPQHGDADFELTWNRRVIEFAIVYWEREHIAPGCCHSMIVFRQLMRGKGTGLTSNIRKFSRDHHLCEPKEIDEIKRLGRWDKGWEGVIQHLMCQDASNIWR